MQLLQQQQQQQQAQAAYQQQLLQNQGMMAPGQMMYPGNPGQYPGQPGNPMMQQYGLPVAGPGGSMYPMQIQGLQNIQPGMQMQLQQDPRTGLFSLVPVQTLPGMQQQGPGAPSHSSSPSHSHTQGDTSRVKSPESDRGSRGRGSRGPTPDADRYRGRLTSPDGDRHSRHIRTLSPSSPDELDDHLDMSYEDSTNSLPRRYRKHGGSANKDKEVKYRSRSDSSGNRDSANRDISAERPPTGKPKAKQRPRSAGRDGRNGRAKTLSGGDIGRELQRLKSLPGDLEKISEFYERGQQDFEGYDRETIQELREYRERSKSIGALETRTKVRRSNSGSAVDYYGLQVKVNDIPIDSYRHRERSRDREMSPYRSRDQRAKSVDRRDKSGDRRARSGDRRREKSGDRRTERSDDRRRERSGDRHAGRGDRYAPASRSHQNASRHVLGGDDLSPEERRRSRGHRPRSSGQRHHDSMSPVRSPLDGSPSASPPLSKDSGVSSHSPYEQNICRLI